MIQKKIVIKGTDFYYYERDLAHGQKRINMDISRNNLELLCNILNKTDIKYGLIFGTLLGAVREKSFIPYDEDSDMFILSEYRDSFLELLFEIKASGLELVRINEGYLSLMKDEEYIDIYFFELKKKYLFYKVRHLLHRHEVAAKYMDNPIPYTFLGINLFVPNHPEIVLKKLYGKTWKIPLENSFAIPNTFWRKLIYKYPFLKKNLFYRFIKMIK